MTEINWRVTANGVVKAAGKPTTAGKDRLATLAAIAAEAKTANDVIRLGRDGDGPGRVRVATAMHRIALWAEAAITEASSS